MCLFIALPIHWLALLQTDIFAAITWKLQNRIFKEKNRILNCIINNKDMKQNKHSG